MAEPRRRRSDVGGGLEIRFDAPGECWELTEEDDVRTALLGGCGRTRWVGEAPKMSTSVVVISPGGRAEEKDKVAELRSEETRYGVAYWVS